MKLKSSNAWQKACPCMVATGAALKLLFLYFLWEAELTRLQSGLPRGQLPLLDAPAGEPAGPPLAETQAMKE